MRPATHVARGVWQVKLPAATGDFEYFLDVKTVKGETLLWPASAPEMNQAVVE